MITFFLSILWFFHQVVDWNFFENHIFYNFNFEIVIMKLSNFLKPHQLVKIEKDGKFECLKHGVNVKNCIWNIAITITDIPSWKTDFLVSDNFESHILKK